jgi:hypothetical protein
MHIKRVIAQVTATLAVKVWMERGFHIFQFGKEWYVKDGKSR